MFTWIPIYKELAEGLLEYRDKQGELILILKHIATEGIPMIKLKDQEVKDGEGVNTWGQVFRCSIRCCSLMILLTVV